MGLFALQSAEWGEFFYMREGRWQGALGTLEDRWGFGGGRCIWTKTRVTNTVAVFVKMSSGVDSDEIVGKW